MEKNNEVIKNLRIKLNNPIILLFCNNQKK